MCTENRPFHIIPYRIAQRSSGWVFPSLPGSGVLSLSMLSPQLHGLWRFIKPLTGICVCVCVCVCVYSLGRGHLFSSDLLCTERCFEIFCRQYPQLSEPKNITLSYSAPPFLLFYLSKDHTYKVIKHRQLVLKVWGKQRIIIDGRGQQLYTKCCCRNT